MLETTIQKSTLSSVLEPVS